MSTDDKTRQKIVPAPICAICGRPLSKIGGCRLVASSRNRFVGKTDTPSNENGPDKYSLSAPLGDSPEDGYALVAGYERFCTKEALERVVQALQNGQTPWFCQECAMRICNECGAPINRPVASDYISKDDRIVHCAIFPFDPGCCNPECKRYRKLESCFSHADSPWGQGEE